MSEESDLLATTILLWIRALMTTQEDEVLLDAEERLQKQLLLFIQSICETEESGRAVLKRMASFDQEGNLTNIIIKTLSSQLK